MGLTSKCYYVVSASVADRKKERRGKKNKTYEGMYGFWACNDFDLINTTQLIDRKHKKYHRTHWLAFVLVVFSLPYCSLYHSRECFVCDMWFSFPFLFFCFSRVGSESEQWKTRKNHKKAHDWIIHWNAITRTQAILCWRKYFRYFFLSEVSGVVFVLTRDELWCLRMFLCSAFD